MQKGKWITLIVLLFMVPSLVFSQLQCLYISTTSGLAPVQSDPIVEEMQAWGYVLDFINTTEAAAMTLADDWVGYDFIFVDEVVGSATLEPIDLLEGHVLPLVTTENYAPRANILGYCTNTQATNIGAEPVKIHNGDHHMAAGFATDSEVVINLGGGANEDLIPNLPEIDFIPIAESTSMEGLYIIYGIEEGGQTVNGVDIINKGAIVGFHANGYATINDNGFAFLRAACEWVTGATDVREEIAAPASYSLAQNYPNPFNPETTIEFQLKKAGHTTISIYNAIGQLMTTLINHKLSSGTHKVTFQAGSYPAGLYYYKIQSGDFSAVRKMLLMK